MIRTIIALVLGLAGSIFIWIAAPLNLQLLNNGLVSDSYFPEIAALVMLVLVLIINPLLKLFSRKNLFIDTRQLSLIFVILLLACTVPTQGLLRALPYSLAKTTQESARNPQLAQIHADMNLPPSLFPDRITEGADTPNSSYLLEELPDGASIPWAAWIPPLLSWGTLLIAIWMLMLGMGMIVYPQWRDNERLPFPLLELEQSLIGPINPEKRIPPIFKDKLFWLGCGIVLFLYSLNGLAVTTHGKFPTFPLGWNLSGAFSDDPWRHLPWRIKSVNKIFFVLIGVAYFMPKRISFSIWFTTLAFGVYQMVNTTYAPPYDTAMTGNIRNGATFAVGCIILFTGRQYWTKVGRNMIQKSMDPGEQRNKRAGWIFVSGWVGIVAWLMWAGMSFGWAMGMAFIGFFTSLVIARIVAETGVPFVRLYSMSPSWLVGLFPAGMISATALYLSGFLSMILIAGSRISPAAMMTHAMGVDKEITPKEQSRLPVYLIVTLLLGLVIAGAVHLNFAYNNFSSMDGQRLTSSGYAVGHLTGSENKMLALSRDAHNPVTSKALAQTAVGGAATLALTIACLTIPAWPLHPIGLLMVDTFYAQIGWASILIGWAAKTLILRYGGASTYKRLRNIFIGMILGEIFAAVIWVIIPVILILNGADPTQIGKLRIVPG